MIRINLLGQTRPKSARRPVDTGAALPAVFIGAGVVLGGLVLGYMAIIFWSVLIAASLVGVAISIAHNGQIYPGPPGP